MLDNNKQLIYEQIAEWTEDQILSGRLNEGDKIFSQIEYARFFVINAMTAARGVDLLVSRGVIDKRKGIGMFVAAGARELITEYRKNEKLLSIMDDLWIESNALGMESDAMIALLLERQNLHKDKS